MAQVIVTKSDSGCIRIPIKKRAKCKVSTLAINKATPLFIEDLSQDQSFVARATQRLTFEFAHAKLYLSMKFWVLAHAASHTAAHLKHKISSIVSVCFTLPVVVLLNTSFCCTQISGASFTAHLYLKFFCALSPAFIASFSKATK